MKHTPKPLINNIILIFLALVALALIVFSAWFFWLRTSNAVPANISRQVDYFIAYPDPAQLPSGYRLEKNSFTVQDGAVIYVINGGERNINVSVQAKPGGQIVDNFITLNMPLHFDVQTPLGTAKLGIIHGQTVASLVTEKVWIIITAPKNIDQEHIKQILRSLKQ